MKKEFNVLVLLTGYPREHSGAGKRIHQQYSRLKEHDASINWNVLTKSESGSPDFCDGPRLILNVPPPKNIKLPKIIRILQEVIWAIFKYRQGLLNNVDALHVAGFSYYMLPIVFFARRNGLTIVREMVTTGDVGNKQSVGALMTRLLNSLSSSYIAISPLINNEFNKLYPEKASACILRPNPVDTQIFFPASAQARLEAINYFNSFEDRVNLKSDNRIIGMLGRIRASKGQHLLIEAMAKSPGDYKALIVGPTFEGDNYIQTLRESVRYLGLRNRVKIVDILLSRPLILQRADVFAFSSMDEGLGNVVLEALCSGIPVAGFKGVGGNDWIIDNGLNGFLCETNSIKFAKAIEHASHLKIDIMEIQKYRQSFSPQTIDAMLLRLLKNCQ